jgi:tRNA(Ile)-lysidine synthase
LTRIHQLVRRTIQRHDLCPPGSRLLVALSGGSDSVALTLLLRDLAEYGGFSVAGLAHLNHQLRTTAARDEAFCRAFAGAVGLPIAIESADVKGYAASHGLSVEDAARRVRYAFLGRAAAAVGATGVAVGHTQDDQAETFLLKLMRGAGPKGLGGIYPRRGIVVRPLLDASRSDLRAFLAAAGQTWVDDETNDDVDNPRNRVRHVVLPELDRTAGGATRPAIARAAALLREDAQWLDAMGRQRFEGLAVTTADGVELPAAALGNEPAPLRRRVVLEVLREGSNGREVGLEHVEAVIALLGTNSGGVDVPGARVELRRGKLVLIRQTGPAK